MLDCCASNKTQKGGVMKKFILPIMFAGAIGSLPVLAQEQKGMPMKESMPMKGEGMKGGGMMMDKMKDMQGHMAEMRKGVGGMMKGKGMMKGEEMKGMGKSMGEMSGMMGEMRKMMESGKMTHEEMEGMSKMMSDMSGMIKQMSDRMKMGMKQSQ